MSHDPAELSKTRSFDFKNRGGARAVDGKTYWPTFLYLSMTKDEALDLAMNILRQYQVQNEPWRQKDPVEKDRLIMVSLVGEMVEQESVP